jgi:thioredoxin-dependent peroxiredoxin
MYRVIRAAVAAGLFAVSLALTGAACAADDPKKPGVGDKFPNIAVPATQAELVKKDAKKLSISDLKGKFVVIAFYPKALTGG